MLSWDPTNLSKNQVLPSLSTPVTKITPLKDLISPDVCEFIKEPNLLYRKPKDTVDIVNIEKAKRNIQHSPEHSYE